ncbi:nucleotidyl transferase AbiEii/AbiGii toxin family protein, partial [Frankia sp. Ag45/Mut15]
RLSVKQENLPARVGIPGLQAGEDVKAQSPPIHLRLARIGLRVGGPYGFALAGGHAVAAHGILQRPSEDVDLFADWDRRADFPAAVDAVIVAYRADGLEIATELRTELIVRRIRASIAAISPPCSGRSPGSTMPTTSPPTLHCLRTHLRNALQLPGHRAEEIHPTPCDARPLDELARFLESRESPGILMAFPAAPFLLGLVLRDPTAFIRYCRAFPNHPVNFTSESQPEVSVPVGAFAPRQQAATLRHVWHLRPVQEPSAHEISVSLPVGIEDVVIRGDSTFLGSSHGPTLGPLSSLVIPWVGGTREPILPFQLVYGSGWPGDKEEGCYRG